MIRFQFFWSIYFINTIIVCNGMELKSALTPRYAKYLTNDRIIVSNKNGCALINPITDTEIKQINNFSFAHIALHPHKIKFAVSDCDNITLYNAHTTEVEWIVKDALLHPPVISSVICPFEDTIFVNYANIGIMTRHTRHLDKFLHYAIELPVKKMFAFSPTEPLKCTVLNTKGTTNTVYIRDYDMSQPKKILSTKINLIFCQYSPNGSIIASGNKHYIYILNPTINNKHALYIKHKENESFEIIEFHPNSLVLATLAKPYNTLCYWDITTQKPISSSSLSSDKHCTNYDLSFSPDGTKIIVALSKKCIIIPVPFEVIYASITKENAIFMYLLLHTILPKDIIQLITKIILAKSKR